MTTAELQGATIEAGAVLSWRSRVLEPTVVLLRGEHDISTVPALAGELARAIASNDGDLALDLSAVDFMDASTVSVILGARQFLEPRRRTLTLRSPTRSAQRIIAICDLEPLLEHPTGSTSSTPPPAATSAS